MTSLTCVTCRIKFIGDNDDIEKATELQRLHFQSDWHRYNLKRKTVDLPPISAEVFDEKVQLLENVSVSRVISFSIHTNDNAFQFFR